MRQLNTILFDLDGTLIDTNEIILKSYIHAYETHLPNKAIDEAAIIDSIGAPLRDVFKRDTNDKDLVEALINTYLDYYTKHEHSLFHFYEGIEPMLEKLKAENYNLAIVTTKFLSSAQPSIDYFNLGRFFDVIITLEDTLYHKPDAAPVIEALSHFDDVDKSIMIGDNTSDIMAGNNAGILSAGVAWSIKKRKTLSAANPTYMLETPEDIFTIIDNESEEK